MFKPFSRHNRDLQEPSHEARRLGRLLFLSAIVAALLLLMVSTRPATASTIRPSTTISDLELQMFNLINHDRAAKGLPALTWNATLASGARAHSSLMAHGCGLKHQCSNEPAPGTRITNEGIHWTSYGENIGYYGGDGNYPNDIKQIEQSMINEGPGGYHYDNIMSKVFKIVGVGVSIDSRNVVWVTEDFVQP